MDHASQESAVHADDEHHGLTLPGYTLSTRLGAGGYGEVWLAHAPGGLTKAVKFIFGSFQEKRAEHELRALERIREVRHPFLLSLERIEVVDGRLAIVTELAESSMKDRFDECRREGLPGLPRAELLRCLRDAADALDFLSTKHSLQHLDVKPENLLLVAGHVKVADFGLVKDIGGAQASLVGGLTPLYSAPEVFQGAPSSASDQYSLAVLFQELLTGLLPFSGGTAAELTMQHLHQEPDLSALPTADRYIVARALAKDPAHRFASSSEMIEALLDAERPGGPDWTRTLPASHAAGADRVFPTADDARVSRPGPVTEFFDERLAAERKEVSTSMLLDWVPPPTAPPEALGAIDLSEATIDARPTLVIGIGGLAASVLRGLRGRLSKQFGDSPLPAMQLLLLDSDPKAIAGAMQGDAASALRAEETLNLPLRRPQDYRDQSSRLTRSLSRRWIYNIPRSLRTEGLRPLGRLALADHGRQAMLRIRMSLAAATEPESLRISAESAGVAFRPNGARVYVVASICGGAGSGMSLDVAHAVRAAIDKAGLDGAETVGVMLHSTGRDPRHCDLAKVNAYAWLTEYNHYHRPGGEFPGDEAAGLPPASGRAFDCAYLVDLGAELDEAALNDAAQSVAEYLYLDALTPAQHFFRECRASADEPNADAAPLRTFAVQRISASSADSIKAAAAGLSSSVVLAWAGIETALPSDETAPSTSIRDTNQVVQGAAKLVTQLQLQLEGLASNARGLIETQLGREQQARLAALLRPSAANAPAPTLADAVAAVNDLFAPPPGDENPFYVLERPLDAIVSPLAMKLASDLSRWVMARLDDRQERLLGAQRAAQWLVDHLQRVQRDSTRLAEGMARQAQALAEQFRKPRRAASAVSPEDESRILNYFRMRVDHLAVCATSLIARRLLAELKSLDAALTELGRHLKNIAQTIPGDSAPLGESCPLAMCAAEHSATLAARVDEEIQASFIDPQGGVFQATMGSARTRSQMLAELNAIALRVMEQFAARPEVLQAALASPNGAAAARLATSLPDEAIPRTLEHGGAFRTLTVAPDHASAAQAARAFTGAEASVLCGVGHDVVTICEGWDLPLVHLAASMIQCRRDYADFASRVHTRTDVPWTPLTPSTARAVVAPSLGDAFAATPTMTQVL